MTATHLAAVDGLLVTCRLCGRKLANSRQELDGSISGHCGGVCNRRTTGRTRPAVVTPSAEVDQLLDDAYAELSVCKTEGGLLQ